MILPILQKLRWRVWRIVFTCFSIVTNESNYTPKFFIDVMHNTSRLPESGYPRSSSYSGILILKHIGTYQTQPVHVCDYGEQGSRYSMTVFSRFLSSWPSSQNLDGDCVMSSGSSSLVECLKCFTRWHSNLTSTAITLLSFMDDQLLITVSLIVAVFLVKKSLNFFAKQQC